MSELSDLAWRAAASICALALIGNTLYGPESAPAVLEDNARERLVRRVQKALRDNRYADALGPLKELTILRPKNQVYWWQLALVEGGLHHPKQQIDALEKFVTLSALPAEACPQLPLLYRELSLQKEALDAWRRCARYAPNDSEMAFFLGHALESEGKIDEALEVYKSTAAHSTNSDVLNGYARMLLRKGQAAEAWQTVSPVIERLPNDGDALVVGGIALSRLGRLAEAKALLERGAAHHADTDIEYALGAIAEREGDNHVALAHFDKALEIDPDNKDARVRRSRLVARKR